MSREGKSSGGSSVIDPRTKHAVDVAFAQWTRNMGRNRKRLQDSKNALVAECRAYHQNDPKKKQEIFDYVTQKLEAHLATFD